MIPRLVYWRSVPHDVDLGYVSYLAQQLKVGITVVCTKDRNSVQKQLCWGECENVKTVILENHSDKNRIIDEIIKENIDAVQIFCGMRGDVKAYLDRYIELVDNKKIVINSEIPSINGCRAERFLRSIAISYVYKRLCKKYSKHIGCFLALSERGKRIFEGYGFDSDVLYPFMYCPKMPSVTNTHEVLNDEVKFIYIGRLDDKNKGIEILMKAVDKLKAEGVCNWTLDIVGGYGDCTDKVYSWADKYSNVSCIGTLAFDDICTAMKAYDVCVVPSHYDGWNMTPNMAINSGCATIITRRATSDELICNSDTGLVTEDTVLGVYSSMKAMCSDIATVKRFKDNTLLYKAKISESSVGKYFMDILDYTFNRGKDKIDKNIMKKPECPWI